MTKKLTDAEKKRRAKERKEERKAEKAAKRLAEKEAAAKAAIAEADKPKAEPPPQDQGQVHLCDNCAYEMGECEGQPKFATEEGADDRVVECQGFLPVEGMPTEDELKAKAEQDQGGPPQEEPTPFSEAMKKLDEFGQSILYSRADEIRAELDQRFGAEGEEVKIPSREEIADTMVEIVQRIIKEEGGPTDGLLVNQEPPVEDQEEAEPPYVPAKPDDRADPKRFLKEEDFGKCPTCDVPLKRTAHSRYQDAVRCTNPRCRAYRAVVKLLSTGVK